MFTCSFRENEFAAFFLFKKRMSGDLEVKTSVSFLGLQVSVIIDYNPTTTTTKDKYCY